MGLKDSSGPTVEKGQGFRCPSTNALFHLMKISFDSTILWLLPYLYLVSVAYYLGFWGTFDIDAVNYYPVSDLVKGVTTPISMTLMIVAVLGAAMAYLKYSAEKIIKKNGISALNTVVVVAGIVAAISLIYRQSTTPGNVAKSMNTFAYTGGFLLAVITLVAVKIESTFTPTSIIKSTLRFSSLVFVLYLPCQANLDGRTNALAIQENEAFNYVEIDSVAAPKGVYKYLGKAGDYHFLLSTDNLKQVIVPSDKMNPLIIERFSRNNQSSVARFTASMNLVSTPTVVKPTIIQKLPKQH
jgi:hypothetical protein